MRSQANSSSRRSTTMSLMDSVSRPSVYVPPEVNPGAKIVIVGEAPGEYETTNNPPRPFVGPAGALLDQCLHVARMARSECTLTNVVKVRPPNNDISPFYRDGLFTAAGKEWVDQLKGELEEYNDANIYVALGNTALSALTGKAKISMWRGSPLDCILLPGKTVIPSIHPSYSIRPGGYLARYDIVSDLKKAKRWADAGQQYTRLQRELIARPNFQEAKAYLDFLLDMKLPVAYDIETPRNNLNHIRCVGFSHQPTFAMCIPCSNTYWTEWEEAVLWKKIGQIMYDNKIPKIAHNMVFDAHFMWKLNSCVSRGELHDTMCAFRLLWPDLPSSLDYIASVYTDEPYWKHTSDQDLYYYNCLDVAVTAEIWPLLMKELEEKGQTKTYYDQIVRCLPAALYMQARGIKRDEEGIKKEHARVSAEIEEKEKLLFKLAGKELNVNSPKQMANFFYVEKGYPPYTKGGSVTTDEKALTRLQRKGCVEAGIVLDLRGLYKYRGTYLNIPPDPDGRLRGEMNPGGTVSGRWSSSQFLDETGANMQNLHPGFKKQLTADDFHVLIQYDKKQAEWVLVAYLAGDLNMIRAVEQGVDLHRWTGSLMFNKPMNEITKPERKIAKSCNHGLNYDMGIGTFALQQLVNDNEARQWYEKYHSAYPGIRNTYHREVQDELKAGRTLYNLLGRRRPFLDRWGDELFKAAYDFKPQSTVGHLISLAVADAYGKKDLLTQTHDSILTQEDYRYPKRMALAVYWMMKRLDIPLKYKGREFVVKTSVDIGFRWGELIETTITTGDTIDEIEEKLRCEVYSKLGILWQDS